jgi:hypothetical protein
MFDLNNYETVSDRVARFQKLHLSGRITTEVVKLDNERGEVLAKACVYREHEDIEPAGVDYAFGIASTYPTTMRKFYVEDTVTSAVGRALSLVLDTDKKPTREDMQKVQAHSEVKAKVEEVKAKMADTSKEYVPVPVESDPWTIQVAAPVQTVDAAVEMVKATLGGTTEKDLPRCPHGEMLWKTGTSKAGKPWGMMKCSAAITRDMPGGQVPCDPIWYEIDKVTGGWKPQVKRG